MHVMHRNWYINITRVLSVCLSMLYMLVHLLHIGFGFKAQRRFQKFGEVQWQLIDLNSYNLVQYMYSVNILSYVFCALMHHCCFV